MICTKCGNKTSKNSKNLCRKCYFAYLKIRENNNMLGKHHTELAKNKIKIKALGRKVSLKTRRLMSKQRKGKRTANTLSKHHIYGKQSKEILILTRSNHTKLHQRAYWYLVKIGKIKNYIHWFKRKYLNAI